MKVAILEDNNDRFRVISTEILANGISQNAIARYPTMQELFLRSGELEKFDLIVLDFFLPDRAGNEARNCVSDIKKLFERVNVTSTPIIAITSFPHELLKTDFDYFSAMGIIIYNFSDTSVWKQAIGSFLRNGNARYYYDFISFCALEEERNGYLAIDGIEPTVKNIAGHEAWEVELDGHKGAIFSIPKMGLVDTAIVTSKVLQSHNPKACFMTGICGGEKNTSLGQVLITSMCWEYQTGKWSESGFQAEPYQITVDEDLIENFKIFLGQNPNIISSLESNLVGLERPTKVCKPSLAIFSSGSAVVANDEVREQIRMQHRKVSGIDMELYAFHRAARLSNLDTKFFSLKTVVDKADASKSDNLHDYGCAISALLAVKLLRTVILNT